MIDEQFELLSFDENSAIISIWSTQYKIYEVKVFVEESFFKKVTSTELATITRLEIDNLPPSSNITLFVELSGNIHKISFKTLSEPNGKLLSSFAFIADTHVSLRKENRKGRMFLESNMLLWEIMQKCNDLKLDFVTISGDLTNDGTPDEFVLCEKTLSNFNMPIIAANGDHDIMCNKNLWENLLEKNIIQSEYQNKYLNVLALDTADNYIKESEIEIVKEKAKQDKILFLVTHVHLLQNNILTQGQKAKGVKNHDDFAECFEMLSQRDTFILAGHQNIPSLVRNGKMVQIQLPQPCQYPCFWILARLYDNELRLKTIPIDSEVLRYYSNKEAVTAANSYNENQWHTKYRQGVGATGMNISILG